MKLKEMPVSFKVSAALASSSLLLAFLFRNYWSACIDPWGYALLGLWALVPPLWFLFEFASDFPKDHKKPPEEVERLKHLHDLSRNIWLAFVVVLAAIMGVRWPLA